MGYTIEQTSRDVVTLRHTGVGADWRQRYLLLADVHFDSPHCNRRLLKTLLQEAQRQSAWVGDADIFVGGHVHEQWSVWSERLRISDKGVVYRDTVLHLCLPTLKDEYEMAGGFHVEKGRPPKPQGAYWLEFRHDAAEHGRVCFDVARG